MNDEVEVSVELSAGGSWSSGPMTMQQLDQAVEAMSVLPEKYKTGGPYVYIATRPYCKCPFAIHPLGYDNKAAGRVLAEWGKAGWTIHTIGKAALMLSDMLICTHEAPKEQEPLVYVAERFCGCTVGVQPPIPGGEAGVAKASSLGGTGVLHPECADESGSHLAHMPTPKAKGKAGYAARFGQRRYGWRE